MTTRQKTSGKSESQKRHGGDVVPVPTGSSSHDGPPEEMPTRCSGELASVREGSSRKDSSSSSAKSAHSAGTASRMSEEREEDERPEDWVLSYLPRYTELIDKTVAWEEYYEKAWRIEGLVASLQSEKKEWKKDRAAWKKEKKEMNAELDELELSILDMRDLEENEEKLKKKVLELEKEVEGKKERKGHSMSTQTGVTLEQVHLSGKMRALDEKIEKIGRGGHEDGGGDRPAGAGCQSAGRSPIRRDDLDQVMRACPMAHGGGLPLTSEDEAGAPRQPSASSGGEEEGEASRSSLPSVVRGAP